MSAKTLIRMLKKIKKETEQEFINDNLEFDDDTIMSVELSVDDVNLLIGLLEYDEESEDDDDEDYEEYSSRFNFDDEDNEG